MTPDELKKVLIDGLGSVAGKTAVKNVAKGSIKEVLTSPTYYRYMTVSEAQAVTETGMLRGLREGKTYYTTNLFSSAESAKSKLALEFTPEVRMKFTISNEPKLIKNGTFAEPAYGGKGGGIEFMTYDKVGVEIIDISPLK
ncbi:hypothetical protein [Endomicrobium proavitum]|uniref:Transposase n=1 Tax=Endomicrobium proavitum TaxID=1408281 RepID=A0A0G3WLP8_9BACT|nr:hypothetical protein [Endomicrobium proavitum]AKL98424.1 transposase [Endomicrobium proavitum]